jgi:hypothetical protein
MVVEMSGIRLTLGAACLVASLAGTAPAMAVTFYDGTLNPSDYALTSYAAPGVFTTFGQTSNGNPGTALQATYSTSGANPVGELFTAINTGFVYNPLIDGAIGSLSASLDRYFDPRVDGDQSNVGSYSLRVFAEQDGNTYQAIFSTPSGQPGGYWLNLAQSGIAASDFKLFDPSNYADSGSATGLNYAGDAITFGFGMRASGAVDSMGAPVTTSSSGTLRADNFRVTVNGAVPEPATWAMLVVGFGMIGGALRMRRKPAYV